MNNFGVASSSRNEHDAKFEFFYECVFGAQSPQRTEIERHGYPAIPQRSSSGMLYLKLSEAFRDNFCCTESPFTAYRRLSAIDAILRTG